MNLAALDLNLLVALDALLLEGNVGRAAMRIGLSQPAASHALRRLRDVLGNPLLVRVGARMELTPRAHRPCAVHLPRHWSKSADCSSRMSSMPAKATATFG